MTKFTALVLIVVLRITIHPPFKQNEMAAFESQPTVPSSAISTVLKRPAEISTDQRPAHTLSVNKKIIPGGFAEETIIPVRTWLASRDSKAGNENNFTATN